MLTFESSFSVHCSNVSRYLFEVTSQAEDLVVGGATFQYYVTGLAEQPKTVNRKQSSMDRLKLQNIL